MTSADLEVSVSLLIQLDKLVQLLESPVFTCQWKALPEPMQVLTRFSSSSLATPRAGQESVPLQMSIRSSYVPSAKQCLCYAAESIERRHPARLHACGSSKVSRRYTCIEGQVCLPLSISSSSTSSSASSSIPGRSTIRRNDDIRWQDLLTHFRQVQMKHERARRSHMNDSDGQSTASAPLTVTVRPSNGANARRKPDQGPPSVTSRAPSGKAGSAASRGSPLSGRPLSPPLPGSSGSRAQKRVTSMGRTRIV